MNYFDSDRLVLRSEAARALYRGCRDIPVFDYHNHLSPQMLYENRPFRSMADFWLNGDHYIWRAMRIAGLPEELITGNRSDEEKFLAWAGVLDTLVGCQLYAWAQMQIARLFGEEEPLCSENAREMLSRCNAKLQTEDFRPRALLKRFKVEALCTTDDPADSLEWHEKLRREVRDLTVLPAYRPDKYLAVNKPDWLPALKRLSERENMPITSLEELCAALEKSLDRFVALGCRTSDHGYEGMKYTDPAGAEAVFAKALAGEIPTQAEADAFASRLLAFLGEKYAERNMVMQLHFGALRNGNSRLYRTLGPDVGADSVDDSAGVRAIVPLLDALENKGKLPRTILYCLDESEYTALATLCASFAGEGIRSRVQLGSAWWFLDHERGMRKHLTVLMENALLPGFVGMLTDSRSLGSFVRHDYFRRVLCDTVGAHVDAGEFPLAAAQKIVNNICNKNAAEFFSLPEG